MNRWTNPLPAGARRSSRAPGIHCVRHPDREAEYMLASHYVGGGTRTAHELMATLRSEQVFGPFCHPCRNELVRWACGIAEKEDDDYPGKGWPKQADLYP